MKRQMQILGMIAIALLGMLLVPLEAIAQEVAKPVIDFGPLVAEVAPYAIAALAALAIWGFKLIRDWIKAKTGYEIQLTDQEVREVLERIIKSGITLILGKLDGKMHLTVSNAHVASIANYVILAAPDAVKRFGLTPERLADMIKARIPSQLPGEASVSLPAPETVNAPPAPA